VSDIEMLKAGFRSQSEQRKSSSFLPPGQASTSVIGTHRTSSSGDVVFKDFGLVVI